MVYFPVTCEIVHKGHIDCLEWLSNHTDWVMIGLLSDKALKGYKKCKVNWEDRRFVLEHICIPDVLITIVRQNELSPYKNLLKYKPEYIASGDGWEKEELQAIEDTNVKMLNIDLPKKWSSSKILCRKKQ